MRKKRILLLSYASLKFYNVHIYKLKRKKEFVIVIIMPDNSRIKYGK